MAHLAQWVSFYFPVRTVKALVLFALMLIGTFEFISSSQISCRRPILVSFLFISSQLLLLLISETNLVCHMWYFNQ